MSSKMRIVGVWYPMTPHPQQDKIEQLKKHLQQLHNDGFKVIADCESISIELASQTPAPAAPYPISNIEFAKGLAECLGNEPEEHEECNICPLRGKCIDLNLMVDAATIRNQTLDKIIPTLGRAIQTDISDNDYVMIEDLKSVIESLRTQDHK